MNPTCTRRRPLPDSASTSARAVSASVASGFSHSTGLPSSRQASTSSAWVRSGEATTTASTSSARTRSAAVAAARVPAAPATWPARARSGSNTQVTRAAGTAVTRVRTWSAPMAPAPTTPTRSCSATVAVSGGADRRPATRGCRLLERVDGPGGHECVVDRRSHRLARGNGLDEAGRLDHLEVVEAHRVARAGLEGAELAHAGAHEDRGPRGVLVVLVDAGPQLTHPPVVPRDGAQSAVHLDAVGALVAHLGPARLEDGARAVGQPEQGAHVVLVL